MSDPTLPAFSRDAILASEALELRAYRSMVEHAPAAVRERFALRVREFDGATALSSRELSVWLFQRVVGLGSAQPATEAQLDRILAAYRDDGHDKLWLHLAPIATPHALPDWFAARGFVPHARRSWAKMARGTEPPPALETPLAIGPLARKHAAEAGALVCQVFGLPAAFAPAVAALADAPDWHCYAAVDQGRIVATGFMFVDGDAAWFSFGATHPEHRNRRAQGALMALRIRDALELGCTRIETETGEAIADEPNPSLANMVRCGFRKLCSRYNYAN